ncbi:MAG: glycoside hydrolase [Myxococcaceae bacterium]
MKPTTAWVFAGFCLLAALPARGQTITVDTSPAGRQQVIDGFGTCLSGDDAKSAWFQQLYYDQLACSILRIDMTPPFAAPYSDAHYNSPWFGQTPSINDGGPEGNNVRTYTDASDYTRPFGGQSAQIAVMGPNIDDNVQLFDFTAVAAQGTMAQLGLAKKGALGDFKLYGSLWSPAPWLKISSGNRYPGGAWPLPAANTSWPFVWGGNFSGGMLDTSETPLAVFGGTSALTQFARAMAAYLRGFQTTYGVRFYAISIQNEVNFEEFYNSCSYPLSAQYIKALKATRAELDKYADLTDILIAGPEDLLGGDAWGLWQYGSGGNTVHKNLQYLDNLSKDPVAAAAVSFFNIHGYDSNGASSAGANSQLWSWWAQGWNASPNPGLPAKANGFTFYGKRSWMTETSGEATAWLSPATGFPNAGGWSLALKMHQALTTGRQSGWLYWQLSDGSPASAQTLTDSTRLAGSPKLVAIEHFFRHIRPGAQRVTTTVSGSATLLASSYLHEANGTLTLVLVNSAPGAATATLTLPPLPTGVSTLSAWTSSDGSYRVASTLPVAGGQVTVTVPGYGVVTLVGAGAQSASDGGTDAGTSPADAGADDAGTPDPSDGGPDPADAGIDGPPPGATGGCGCAALHPGLSLVAFALLAFVALYLASDRRR